MNTEAQDTTARCDYFADHSAVSQSMLKVFADRRRLYEAYYVTRTLEQPKKAAYAKGTATHTALLEPDKFAELVVTIPEHLLAKNGAASTNEAKAFIAANVDAGKTVLKQAEYDVVLTMAESVRKVCGSWLSLPGVKEKPLRWDCEQTGLPLKLRLDLLVKPPTGLVLFDVKTTIDASPREFRRACENFGYGLQTVHYIDGVERVFGETPEFYFIAVESEPPFACAIYQLDAHSLAAARGYRERLLFDLKDCIVAQDFSEPWERKINTLSLRNFYQD